MSVIDKVIIINLCAHLLFAVVYLLYQFEVWDISEDFMIHWVRLMNIIETALLVITRFCTFGKWGSIGLTAFYILNVILLILQFIFAEFGLGRKILDLVWISYYVVLFLVDVCKISISQILETFNNSKDFMAVDQFLSNSFFGKLIVSAVVPVIRGLIVDAIQRNE